MTGMHRLAPGVYDDGDGTLHLDVPELLEAHGYADTPANRDTLIAAAQEAFSDLLGHDVPVEVLG